MHPKKKKQKLNKNNNITLHFEIGKYAFAGLFSKNLLRFLYDMESGITEKGKLKQLKDQTQSVIIELGLLTKYLKDHKNTEDTKHLPIDPDDFVFKKNKNNNNNTYNTYHSHSRSHHSIDVGGGYHHRSHSQHQRHLKHHHSHSHHTSHAHSHTHSHHNSHHNSIPPTTTIAPPPPPPPGSSTHHHPYHHQQPPPPPPPPLAPPPTHHKTRGGRVRSIHRNSNDFTQQSQPLSHTNQHLYSTHHRNMMAGAGFCVSFRAYQTNQNQNQNQK